MPDLKPEERHALTLLARGSIGRALAMAEGGQLASYQRLVAALAAAPADHLVLDELSGELARTAERRRPHGCADLDPGAARARDRGAAWAASDPRCSPTRRPSSRLAARRPLDRWATLWDKVARLAAAAEGLSLERSHALMQMLTLLAPDADRADRRSRRRTRSQPCPRLTRSTSPRRSTTSTTRRTSGTPTPRWRATRSPASPAWTAAASASSPAPTSTGRRWRRRRPRPARRRRRSPTRCRSAFAISPAACASPTTTSSAPPSRGTGSGCRRCGASWSRATRSISAPTPAGIRCATSRSTPRASWSTAGRRPARRWNGSRSRAIFFASRRGSSRCSSCTRRAPTSSCRPPGATRW